MTRRSHHLLTLTAAVLAVAVAAGVATPRPRLGRERALRTVVLAACTRPDQPCAWGPAEDPEPDVTVAAGDSLVSEDRPGTAADAGVLPGGRFDTSAATPRLAATPDTVAAAAGARSGRPPGRAPPAFRS